MYWPIGTPRVYATSSSRAPGFNLFVSNDGLSASPHDSDPASPSPGDAPSRLAAAHDDIEIHPPPTPITPITPAVQSVEHDDNPLNSALGGSSVSGAGALPLKDPVLALRVSRAGHLFAVITATSITVWQTKVPLIALPRPIPSS